MNNLDYIVLGCIYYSFLTSTYFWIVASESVGDF